MPIKIALTGNPNCGKTTLFNKYTGSNQYVGNWAGVTVEKKEGNIQYNDRKLTIVDLPGIYSLSPYSMEEIITRDFILLEKPDVIVDVIDGTNIERNLYLAVQLIELAVPLIIAINMMDAVTAKGDSIDCEMLSRKLKLPVIPISARKGENIGTVLESAIALADADTSSIINDTSRVKYDQTTRTAIDNIQFVLEINPSNKQFPLAFFSGKALESDLDVIKRLDLTQPQRNKIEQISLAYESTDMYGDRETMLADARYKFIENICNGAVSKDQNLHTLTVSDRIDQVLTNRIMAIPIFLLIMLLMFSTTFGPIGEGLKSIISYGIDGIITPAVVNLLDYAIAPSWTYGLLVGAIISGVGSVLSFLPQIMILFLFLSVLEDSGYMARAAFIMDRLLTRIGLTGKSFIPMLMGFGCTTPAVMAARAMDNERDRRLTIMITPFMSCGAKLPIYGLFASIFFVNHKGFVVFSMYIIGMIVAILCGLLLKNTLFKGEVASFVMELPPYRLPTLSSLSLHVWEKCKGFLVKAGTVIFSMSVVIWLLQNFNIRLQMVEDNSQSIFAMIGRFIAPIFAPLGFGTWQASVSILAGLVAKETVVSSMVVLYGVSAQSELGMVLKGIFTPLSAFSFMTFCLLYMPCLSAFISIKREMNSVKWAVGTALFGTGVAYIVSLAIFCIGTLVLAMT